MSQLAASIWPLDGIDFDTVKQINLLLIVGSLVLLAARRPLIRAGNRLGFRIALALLALVSVINYSNYFSFHGERTFLHLHDMAHYYLGAKYSPELGYDSLYVAILRAEAEVYDDRFLALEARDLETNRLVDIRRLLTRSDSVKARFSGARWNDFKQDVVLFRESLGPHWPGVLRDHGYNPTPAWTLMGSWLANRVPAGSRPGLVVLALLDPLLLGLVFLVLARSFGAEAMAWSLIYFCVIFGATFGWTGGAFLRQAWFACLLCGFCALHARRFAIAGGLFAMATMTRLFPLLFVLPLVGRALGEWLHRRRLPSGHARLWLAFASVVVLGATASTVASGGTSIWHEFRQRIETQIRTVSPNVVGLTQVLTFQRQSELVTEHEFAHVERRRQAVHRAQIVTVAPLVAVLVLAIAARSNDDEAMTLGVPLVLVMLNLAGYYFTFLILLLLTHRRSTAALSVLFAAESIPYLLMLFGAREAALYVGWSAALLVAVFLLYRRAAWYRLLRLDVCCHRWFQQANS